MIVSLEGVPATGKTTTAEHLVRTYDAVRIPEVNVLYPNRPNPEPQNWYYARQVDRWKAAEQDSDRLVVLDGDPYQPVWFSWVYPDRGFPAWWKALDYFEASVESIGVPDYYIYLQIDAQERYRREAIREKARGHDQSRLANKFQRYANLLGPQRAFFEAINEEFTGFVLFVEANDLDTSAAQIIDYQTSAPEIRAVFRFMRDWFSHHNPREFC